MQIWNNSDTFKLKSRIFICKKIGRNSLNMKKLQIIIEFFKK